MMETLMQFSIYLVGFLFWLMVLSGLILFFVARLIQEIKRREELELKHRIMSLASAIERYCGHEFPEVDETCKHIWKVACGERAPDAIQFRERLREMRRNTPPKKDE